MPQPTFDLQRRCPELPRSRAAEERQWLHQFVVGTRQGHEGHDIRSGWAALPADKPRLPLWDTVGTAQAHPSSLASARGGTRQQGSRNASVIRAELRQRFPFGTRPLRAADENSYP